jgi:NDP-sugar pyrophosphorylase family protein
MRPLIEFVVKLMVYHGVPGLVLLSGYRGEEIERYFGDGARYDLGSTEAFGRLDDATLGSNMGFLD